MDSTEEQVKKYLCKCGFTNIVYEPDGNIPPDFLVNNKIAIEVSRLNIHYENQENRQKPYAHEQYFPKVWQGLEQILKEFVSASNSESWYVMFSLAHPFNSWATIKNGVRDVLKHFKESERLPHTTYRIQNSLEISFLKCGTESKSFYVMGGGSEDEMGCLVISKISRNLKIIVEKKEHKVSTYRYKYSKWWLILVDLISYGNLDSHDLEQFHTLPKIESNWDRILVISPHDSYLVFEY